MKAGTLQSCFKGFMLSIFVGILIVGCAAPEVERVEPSPSMQKAEAPEPSARVSRISTEALVGKMRVTIEADSELTYTAFKLSDPLRLVLDLPNIDTAEVSELTFQDTSPLLRITPFQFTDGDVTNSRIEIALSRLVPYQVFNDNNKLFIDLETPVQEVAMTSQGTSELPPGFEELTSAEPQTPIVIDSKPEILPIPSEKEAVPSKKVTVPQKIIQQQPSLVTPVPTATVPEIDVPTIQITQPPKTVGEVTLLPGTIPTSSVITDLQITEADGKTRLSIHTDKIPEFEIRRSQTPPRLTIDLKQSDLPPDGEKVLTPRELKTTIKQVRVFQLRRTPDGRENTVRVLVDLMKPTKHEVLTEPGKLMVELDHQRIFAKTDLPDGDGGAEVPLTTGIEAALEAEEPEVPAEAQVATEPTIRAPKTGEEKEYKGQLISIHFQEADILDVLQVIAEVSGLNLVVHPNVSGNVTVHLTNIPWDQALDIILKMNQLSVEIEGNILRVASADVFQREIDQLVEQQRKQIEARKVQEELEPLETQLITINFADPGSIVGIIEGYFQGAIPEEQRENRRGTITVDERTKTLIVQDTEENIEKIEEIVATLDRRTPQVMIEARVVSLSSYFRKELGINWSGSFSADPEHGNPFDYRFPYTVNIPEFGVNLPGVGDPVGSTGPITIGSIDDVLTIFARIDAAEEESKAKTLGQPKIFTQDNVSASVSAGQVRRITETTTSNGVTTTTTSEVPATLTLDVTPRISSDGYITMEVSVSNDAFTASTGTDVNTQEVNSQITVKDGETVVIGGVFTTSEIDSFSAVPFLHRIPILGHLFKSKLPNSQSQEELLVFLTPRILDSQILGSQQENTGVSYSY